MKTKAKLYPIGHEVIATSQLGKKYKITHYSYNATHSHKIYHGKGLVSGPDVVHNYTGPCQLSRETLKSGYYTLSRELEL